MAHLCKKSTTKHLIKKASGHLKRGCLVCGNCPATLTLTVSGLTSCGCVVQGGSGRRLNSSPPNGTFTLTRISSGTTCIWRSASLGSIINEYNAGDTTCSGSVAGTTAALWQLDITNTGTMTLTCGNYIFYATGAVGDCDTSLSFTGPACGFSVSGIFPVMAGGTASAVLTP